MSFLKNLFHAEEDLTSDPNYSDALERLKGILAGLPEKDVQFVACFALLLGQVAYADLEITEGEKARIHDILVERSELSSEQISMIEKITLDTALIDSVETHIVFRRLNEVSTEEQKIWILRSLFQVVCEHDISETESEKIGSYAAAMLLSRDQFLRIRSEFNDHLLLLKNMRRLAEQKK